ncbi:HAAS signaling domain-containing protein [Nocardiopsis valliformis]|uniref:HAAS signaling domain-containing protein n=1 Tax=Nocardiopsis valliformis TaxID=239974 RepID=UPI00373AF30D
MAETLHGLPRRQRGDIEAELRALVADGVEDRGKTGADPVTAEREVLTELGAPRRLASGYADRPLFLIGPDLYLDYVRVLKALLSTLVPLWFVISVHGPVHGRRPAPADLRCGAVRHRRRGTLPLRTLQARHGLGPVLTARAPEPARPLPRTRPGRRAPSLLFNLGPWPGHPSGHGFCHCPDNSNGRPPCFEMSSHEVRRNGRYEQSCR